MSMAAEQLEHPLATELAITSSPRSFSRAPSRALPRGNRAAVSCWSLTSERKPAWQTGGVVCLVMSVVAYVACQTFADPDIWGHVKFGQDILQSGSITDRDPYSYLTSGQVWINHEGLTEVIFAAVFALGGSPGRLLVKGGLNLLVLRG